MTMFSVLPAILFTDESNKVVTTPAYMTAGGIAEAYEGISKLVDKVLSLA